MLFDVRGGAGTDDQTDYFESESNPWLTKEEKTNLKQQEEIAKKKKEEKKKYAEKILPPSLAKIFDSFSNRLSYLFSIRLLPSLSLSLPHRQMSFTFDFAGRRILVDDYNENG